MNRLPHQVNTLWRARAGCRYHELLQKEAIMNTFKVLASALLIAAGALAQQVHAQSAPQVVDIPTRSGVSNRVQLLPAAQPKATLLLMAGGHGGLQMQPDGSLKWGKGNFLVRSAPLFVQQGVNAVIVDAPSDRQSSPFLNGFRQTPEHVADLKAIIAWARNQSAAPVWLVGTSRGTQSAGYVATQLQDRDGPDGLVLTSSILSDPKGRPVTDMELANIRIPTLVVHHEADGCNLCAYSSIPALMSKLSNTSSRQLLSFKGGDSKGDPCEAFSHHGFNGQEADVVQQTVAWINQPR